MIESSGIEFSVRLNSGRVVILDKITQSRTYAGLLEGTPNKKLNDQFIAEAIQRASKNPFGAPQETGGFMRWVFGRKGERSSPPEPISLVTPARRNYAEEPGDMQHVLDRQKDYPPQMMHIPEWLPEIECAGVFRSFQPAKDPLRHMSMLTIVWYQESFGLVRADLEKLRDVDWDRYAEDGDW
jgi:hypothetical protein